MGLTNEQIIERAYAETREEIEPEVFAPIVGSAV